MTFPETTQNDIDAVKAACEVNGWELLACTTLEAQGRGSLRNGVCVWKASNEKYGSHSFGISETNNRAGLHGGRYKRNYNGAVQAMNDKVRNHPANPTH